MALRAGINGADPFRIYLSPVDRIACCLHGNGYCILIEIRNGFLEDAKALRDIVTISPNPGDLVHTYPESRDIDPITDNT
jgi:hypothetical protein